MMKSRAVDLAFLLLLLDLVLGQPLFGVRPDALLRTSGSRRTVMRQKGGRLPLYMMELYRTMLAEDRARTPAVNLGQTEPEEGIPGLQDSDSVTHLVAKSSHRVGKKWSIAFDMSSLSANDNVQLAELRIRQPAFTESSSVVDVYHSHKHRCPGCPDSRHLLGRLRARPSSTASSFSWKVFDMTEMLSGWLQRGHGGRRTELQEDEVEEDIQHATADRVVMVVFSSQNSQKTLIRVAERSKYVRTTSSSGARRGREKRHPRTENNGPLCRRTDMWVNFEKFGWADYIVFPKRYNAYQCQGSCPTPVNETFGPTNHAYMQSLLHHHHPDKVPCLSCVPTRLSPLSMLYYENGKMVMKHHEDMVVEECGCE